jgi:hypothetical protein
MCGRFEASRAPAEVARCRRCSAPVAERIAAHMIGSRIGNVRNDDSALIERLISRRSRDSRRAGNERPVSGMHQRYANVSRTGTGYPASGGPQIGPSGDVSGWRGARLSEAPLKPARAARC